MAWRTKKGIVNLAVCYENGDCVSQDKKKAIELCQQAAEMGSTDAMFNLGVCYENGDGVPQDKKKAIELYQRAADLRIRSVITQMRRQDKRMRETTHTQKKTLEILTKLTEYGDTDTDSCRVVCWIHL